jgi:hypothetical protein
VTDLWSAGRHVVKDSHHIARASVGHRFRATLRKLREAL